MVCPGYQWWRLGGVPGLWGGLSPDRERNIRVVLRAYDLYATDCDGSNTASAGRKRRKDA
jgi:hypothetical protein